ncbi:general stress protein [Streptomyces sp. NPDC028722]|uniref:general stress protein n=1 Tax=Streptomyces sp. NPDC028722 TaxID=3155016 RepID=UPI0033F9FC74
MGTGTTPPGGRARPRSCADRTPPSTRGRTGRITGPSVSAASGVAPRPRPRPRPRFRRRRPARRRSTGGRPRRGTARGQRPAPGQESIRLPWASNATYQEAERAVDHLADQGFPVQKVAITGRDVRLVEQVIGRVGYGAAALHGAATGALPGALVGWIFGLLNWRSPLRTRRRT